MPEYVLDTVALRVTAFAHPRGIEFLLTALGAIAARFPTEVYNRDEDALPLIGEVRLTGNSMEWAKNPTAMAQRLRVLKAERKRRSA